MTEDDSSSNPFPRSSYYGYETEFASLDREISIANSKYNYEVEYYSRAGKMLKLAACSSLLLILMDLAVHGLILLYSKSSEPITDIEVMTLVSAFWFCIGIYANPVVLRLRRSLSRRRLKASMNSYKPAGMSPRLRKNFPK